MGLLFERCIPHLLASVSVCAESLAKGSGSLTQLSSANTVYQRSIVRRRVVKNRGLLDSDVQQDLG
jgi:hypothetical protein